MSRNLLTKTNEVKGSQVHIVSFKEVVRKNGGKPLMDKNYQQNFWIDLNKANFSTLVKMADNNLEILI